MKKIIISASHVFLRMGETEWVLSRAFPPCPAPLSGSPSALSCPHPPQIFCCSASSSPPLHGLCTVEFLVFPSFSFYSLSPRRLVHTSDFKFPLPPTSNLNCRPFCARIYTIIPIVGYLTLRRSRPISNCLLNLVILSCCVIHSA